MDNILIYTDGACSGNPGIGGWGAVLIYKNNIKELYGGSFNTTNNKMELTAVIESLKILKRSCCINLYTDSRYVKDGITNWLNNWKVNNWKNSRNQEVLNRDLWEELDKLQSKHDINWYWVKGHSSNELNNKADELARFGIKKLKESL